MSSSDISAVVEELAADLQALKAAVKELKESLEQKIRTMEAFLDRLRKGLEVKSEGSRLMMEFLSR